MMRRCAMPLSVFVLGCASASPSSLSTSVTPVSAPAGITLVAQAPKGATTLGTVALYGTWKSDTSCVQQALIEARNLGATHALVHATESSPGGGIRCAVEAFQLRTPSESR